MVAAAKRTALEQSSIYSEAVYLLADLKKHVAHAPSGSMLYFWAKRGCVNKFTRQRVYLEVISLPVGLGTSYAAIVRFYQALNSRVPLDGAATTPMPSLRRPPRSSFKKKAKGKKKT